MKRIMTITKLKPGVKAEYQRVHNEIWPEVVEANHAANMRNFSIFCVGDFLLSYYEYTGSDYEADLEKKNSLPVLKAWKELTGQYTQAVEGSEMILFPEELWHHDF